jgi:beta-phosphoglucomutase family hydrolase
VFPAAASRSLSDAAPVDPTQPWDMPTTMRAPATTLRLPTTISACLFDLDGVLTDTARIHAAAWKETFDEFLRRRAVVGTPFVPFDLVRDYGVYVDGRARFDGVRSFLASRGIELAPAGIEALGNCKNERVLALIHRCGVEPFDGSVRFVQAARDAGLSCAVVSGSDNCGEVLAAAGIGSLFDVRIDGIVAECEHLRGKPAPDTYLVASQRLGVKPAAAAVFEDALAGVVAGRAGGFGYVVGIDRVGRAAALRRSGADIVVGDLAELLGR